MVLRRPLPFEAPEIESARKRTSMLEPAFDLAATLDARVRDACGEAGRARVAYAYDFARRQAATTGDHPSIALYMSHPLRIALFCLALAPVSDPALLETALVHNAFEVSGLDEAGLVAAGFGPDLAHDVRLLTINRACEADLAYLDEFYGAIEARGPGLSLLRCLDKLDNLLGAAAIGDAATHRSYVDLAERFVRPMAERLDPEFGAYFAAVVAQARAHGPDSAFAKRLKDFTAGAAA
jgi:hypothetical protein